MTSRDLVQDNIEAIGRLFPNCLREVRNADGTLEHQIDFDALKQELEAASEVCVYAKLPKGRKGFFIPTPVGDYSPDWAIAFNNGAVKHIYLIAETKGSLDSLDLRGIESIKIKCAEKIFNELSTTQVRYSAVKDYHSLLEAINNLKCELPLFG